MRFTMVRKNAKIYYNREFLLKRPCNKMSVMVNNFTTERTGVVVEGGGVRGIYAAGVLDALMEHGLSFDGLIGVSAGAIHGCSFLSGQKGRSIRYYRKYCADPRFMSFRSWLATGNLVDVEFCYHELPDHLDVYDHEAFAACKTPFYVTCTNVETGEAEYIRLTDMRTQIDYLRASASLPYFSRIVTIDGKKYLDGGAADSIPVAAFRAMGYQKNVVILTREALYVKKPELSALPRIIYRKYPRFAEALLRRHETYNQTLVYIRELEEQGEIFVIQPKEALTIGRMEKDPEKVQQTYDRGYIDAKECMKELLLWLEK